MLKKIPLPIRVFAAFALAIVVSLGSGCARTVAAVNPRPTVVVEPALGKIALDLTAIPDEQVPGYGLTVTEFRQSLLAGFRNMVGPNYTPQAREAQLVLRIEQAPIFDGQSAIT